MIKPTLKSCILTLFLLSYGCTSSIKQIPPDSEFVEEANKLLKSGVGITENLQDFTPEQIWTRFYLAGQSHQKNNQNQQACDKYQQAAKLNFPLKDLLVIKSLETCSFGQEEFKTMIDQHKDSIQLYAQEQFYKVALQKADTFKVPLYQAQILGELAAYEKTNEGQVEKVQMALKLVKLSTTKDDQSIKTNLIEKLEKYGPRFIKNPDQDKWYEVARDYERVREFRLARNYYQKIIDSNQLDYEIKVKAHWRRSMSFKVGRDKDGYTEALVDMTAWLEELLKNNPDQEEYAKDYFKYQILVARSYWTLQNSKKAMKILTMLAAFPQAKGNALAHILWLKGSIYLEWKKYDSAIVEFQNAFNEEIDDEVLKQRISWSLPWTFYSKGKFKLAIYYYKAAINKIDDEFDKLKYKFWQAKSHLKLNQKELAHELFKNITVNSAYGYYGILSRNELGESFAPMPQVDLIKTQDNELGWLIILNELELAKSYLKLKRETIEPEDYLGYLPYYLKVKDYSQAMRAYFSIPSAIRHQLKNKYDKIIFPTPFLKEVKAAAEKFKISSSFIYSIMRQESAFEPEARSWADAFGLLQLLPKLARELSKRAGVQVASYTDLYHPDTNIKLGARHLKDLQIKKKNKFVLYVSSYNASERAVNNWVKTRFKGDYLEFIERIPYKETRNYVKLVLRNYINYKRELTPEPFLFPKKFFTQRLID